MHRGQKDYRDSAVMRTAALTQSQRRRSPKNYIIGRFQRTDAGELVLTAVKMNPGYWISKYPDFTKKIDEMATWTTKQAAHQWLKRQEHFRDGEQFVLNIDRLTRGRADEK